MLNASLPLISGQTTLIVYVTLFFALGILAGYLAFAYCEWALNSTFQPRRTSCSIRKGKSPFLLSSLCCIFFTAFSLILIMLAMVSFSIANYAIGDGYPEGLYFVYRLAGITPMECSSHSPVIFGLSPSGMAIGFFTGLALSWPRRGRIMKGIAALGALYVVFRLAHIVLAAGSFDLGYFFAQSDRIVAISAFAIACLASIYIGIQGMTAPYLQRRKRILWTVLKYVFSLAIVTLIGYALLELFCYYREYGANRDNVVAAVIAIACLAFAVYQMTLRRPKPKTAIPLAAERTINTKTGLLTAGAILLLAFGVYIGDSIAGPADALMQRFSPAVWNPTPQRSRFGEMKPYSLYSLLERPVKVLDNVVAVAASSKFTSALLADGSIVIFEPTADFAGETQVETITDFAGHAVDIAAGADHILVLLDDGTVYARGNNVNGQLGQGNRAEHAGFVKVHGLLNIANIGADMDCATAIRFDGAAYWWGSCLCVYDSMIYQSIYDFPQRIQGINATQIISGSLESYCLHRELSWGLSLVDNLGRAYAYHPQARILKRDRAPFMRSCVEIYDINSVFQKYIDGRSHLVEISGYFSSYKILDQPVIAAANTKTDKRGIFVITTDYTLGEVSDNSLALLPLPNNARPHSLCSGINRLLILAEE